MRKISKWFTREYKWALGSLKWALGPFKITRFARDFKIGPLDHFRLPLAHLYSLMNNFDIFLTEGQIFLTGQRENKTNKVLFIQKRFTFHMTFQMSISIKSSITNIARERLDIFMFHFKMYFEVMTDCCFVPANMTNMKFSFTSV